MKLVSFTLEGTDKIGILVNHNVYPVFLINPALPSNMADFLMAGEEVMEITKSIEEHIRREPGNFNSYPYHDQDILAPVPHPTSCRDGYAFRQHVAAARRNRGVPMIEEFDQYPIFYFMNHHGIQGPGKILCMPDHFERLDFELEAAILISKPGRNIRAEDADQHIGGLMIMNVMSAR